MTIYDFGTIVMILRVMGKLPKADCTKIKGLLQDMFKP